MIWGRKRGGMLISSAILRLLRRPSGAMVSASIARIA